LHVLFICTGNICRSPTAERLAIAQSALLGIPDFNASSAGTHAVTGHPIHRDAARVLKQLGADTSDFSARQLKPKIVNDADLVITMTREHRDLVLEMAPRNLQRTFTLIEAARIASELGAQSIPDLAALRPQLAPNRRSDVPDPIGQNQEIFEMVGSQIARLLPPLLELCKN
jgi:protein-tyrosine phosphatase